MTDESKIENITKPTPEHIAIAKELHEDAQSFEELIIKIRDVVHDNINNHPNTPYPKTLLESRFSPVDEQYSEGVGSCGAEVNIETDMLRSLGFKVKKVHGSIEGLTQAHAWFKVWSDSLQEWVPYDLTQKTMRPREKHHEIAVCDEWDEIKGLIIETNNKLSKNRIE